MENWQEVRKKIVEVPDGRRTDEAELECGHRVMVFGFEAVKLGKEVRCPFCEWEQNKGFCGDVG
jgi:hypothetical protein